MTSPCVVLLLAAAVLSCGVPCAEARPLLPLRRGLGQRGE
jgi:hypothetical protein